MPEDLDYEQLEAVAGAGDPAASGQSADLRRLRDVPVGLTVEIGRAQMTVGETLALRPGSIIKLDRLADEPLDLLVNGTRIARGEVVVIDEDFGLRITEVIIAGGATIASAALTTVGGGGADEVVDVSQAAEPEAEPVEAEAVAAA